MQNQKKQKMEMAQCQVKSDTENIRYRQAHGNKHPNKRRKQNQITPLPARRKKNTTRQQKRMD